MIPLQSKHFNPKKILFVQLMNQQNVITIFSAFSLEVIVIIFFMLYLSKFFIAVDAFFPFHDNRPKWSGPSKSNDDYGECKNTEGR